MWNIWFITSLHLPKGGRRNIFENAKLGLSYDRNIDTRINTLGLNPKTYDPSYFMRRVSNKRLDNLCATDECVSLIFFKAKYETLKKHVPT